MFPGRSAAKARPRASSTRYGVAEWCAADPGSLQTRSLRRSRISGAPFHAAPHPGNNVQNDRRPAFWAGLPDPHGIHCSLSSAARCAASGRGRLFSDLRANGEHQRTPASRCIRSGTRPHHWFLRPRTASNSMMLSCFALFDGAECELRRLSRLDLPRTR